MRDPASLALIALVGLLTGCINLYSSRSSIRADPMTVERQGEAVFTLYQIPVSERAANGRVESGRFVVQDFWGRAVIEDRVYCGLDSEGEPLALGSRVEMSVTLKIAYRSSGTRIALGSEGRTLPDSEGQDAAHCRLKTPFVQELLDAVADEFPDVTPGPEIPGVPGTVPSW